MLTKLTIAIFNNQKKRICKAYTTANASSSFNYLLSRNSSCLLVFVQFFLPAPVAHVFVAFVAAYEHHGSVVYAFAVDKACVYRGLTSATAHRLDLLQAVGKLHQTFATLKKLATEVNHQAVTQHGYFLRKLLQLVYLLRCATVFEVKSRHFFSPILGNRQFGCRKIYRKIYLYFCPNLVI